MRKVVLVLFMVLVLCGTASAGTVTVEDYYDCSASTWIEIENPTVNPGPSNILNVSDGRIPAAVAELGKDLYKRALLAFQTVSIPTGATLVDAKVIVNCVSFGVPILNEDISLGTGDNHVTIHKVNAPWLEGSATWNNQPSFDSSATYTDIKLISTIGEFQYDVLDTVSLWLAGGGSGQYGFMLETDIVDVRQVWAKFASRLAAADLVPELYVKYTYETVDPDPDPIPEPATMILLGSLATGLFGFSGIRKRHTRS